MSHSERVILNRSDFGFEDQLGLVKSDELLFFQPSRAAASMRTKGQWHENLLETGKRYVFFASRVADTPDSFNTYTELDTDKVYLAGCCRGAWPFRA